MKKTPLILCLISMLLVSTCKKSEALQEESSVELTNPTASVISYSTGGWDLDVLISVNNTSKAERFICKVEYRLLLDEVAIATTDNINQLPLPDSSGGELKGFDSTTDWHLIPNEISLIKYFDTGLNQFMNGQKPQKVEITLYLKNGTSQGDWDFTTKVIVEINYTEIIED
ncbi:MAG TPA: hypothetical protein VMZ49_11130 [Patescibacteria group bacterium]|nr:hypothetical protein [Patescibacteria group bacterium]